MGDDAEYYSSSLNKSSFLLCQIYLLINYIWLQNSDPENLDKQKADFTISDYDPLLGI